jgi:hypothetical protein
VTGFFGAGAVDQAATWVAAILTIIVLAGLLGERRVFGWTQHLLAGLVTGYLALLAVTEVIVPRVIEPLAADPVENGELWVGLALVASAAGAPWLPRAISAIPVSIAIGALAAFALGGAVIGTLLPQVAAAVAGREETAPAMAASVAAAVVTALVLVSFVHGTPRGRVLQAAATTGRWLMLGGIGGWLGYLLLSRLLLLVDRIAFLVRDWLGIVP